MAKISLEENKKLQIDHYRRCKKLISEQTKEYDRITYTKLSSYIPIHSYKKCKLLDLGCGEASAFSYFGWCDYYGIDCCDEAVEIAKLKVKLPEHIIVGFIEELPYPDDYFDVILAKHILEHSSDMEKTLTEINRVLKVNGFLLFALPQGIYDEPAHLFQAFKEGWQHTLSGLFEIIDDGEDNFNLNQYYGVAQPIKEAKL